MRILVTIFALWVSATAAMAQDRAGIEEVIGSQLAAFNARDIDGAWQYASPNIQRLFGSPGNFAMMVQRGYPMVWDNAETRFLELRQIGGQWWQKIMLRDAAGGLHILDYQMIETGAGWQINAVQLLPAPDVGA